MISRKQKDLIRKNVVILGRGGCGKTSVVHRVMNNIFSTKYVPTVFEDIEFKKKVKGKDVVFLLKDTAGQEDYDRLVSLAVCDVDIIILCYCVDSRPSFRDIKEKYIHLIPQQDIKRAKIVLMANKKDLRSEGKGHVTREEGERLGSEIGASWFFESSSKNNEGIHEMFDVLFNWSYNTNFFNSKKKSFWKSIFRIVMCESSKDTDQYA